MDNGAGVLARHVRERHGVRARRPEVQEQALRDDLVLGVLVVGGVQDAVGPRLVTREIRRPRIPDLTLGVVGDPVVRRTSQRSGNGGEWADNDVEDECKGYRESAKGIKPGLICGFHV